VWEQQFTIHADGTPQKRADAVPATERIVTPHDPGVGYGQKRGQGWIGEKVRVTETAERGAPTVITDVTTAPASSGDVEALPAVRAHLAEQGMLPTEQHTDSGDLSGQQLAQSEAAGIVLIGPPLADTSPNGSKIDDVTLDRAARVAICPQGQRSVSWKQGKERDGSRTTRIGFAAATCAACPLRAFCTRGQGGRSLHVSDHHDRLVARRRAAQTPEFRALLRNRPASESTLSELVRVHGFRLHRYRGSPIRHQENLRKATACNLKRLTRALTAPAAPRASAMTPPIATTNAA